MDQSVAIESNRPMYPPPGLDDPNHVTQHPTTAITGHQNMSRRLVLGRRRTLSQTSTAAPLLFEDGSSRSLDLDTVSVGTDETQFPENKRPKTSELPATPSSEREVLGLTDSSETMPGVSNEISDVVMESVNRRCGFPLDTWPPLCRSRVGRGFHLDVPRNWRHRECAGARL